MLTLLTGATGYIGPHILERLVGRGDAVRVLALPETVEQVRYRDRVSIIEGSLADGDILHEATRGVEVVYHLGALLPNSPRRDLHRVNVHGTENLVRASVTAGVRRFVFTSSVAVYKRVPWPFMWPITENFPLKTTGDSHYLGDYAQSKGEAEHAALRFHRYAQSKIEAEYIVFRFHRQHQLEYVILRPTEVYGPPRPWLEQLIKQVINYPAQVVSRAAYVPPIQWVHVSDFAEAVVRAGTLPQAANHVFNIAGSELFALRALIPIVWKIMGRGSWMVPFPYEVRTRGNSGLKYDFSKAQRLLRYTPKVSLQEGLRDLIATISNN